MAASSAHAWHPLLRTLHWLTLVLIAATATLGFWAEELAMGPAKLAMFANHKSLGILVLVFVLIRVLSRFLLRPAPAIEGLSPAQNRLAGTGHLLIYAVLLVLPLSGWWLTSVANFPFRWFGLFEMPMLTPADKAAQDIATTVHNIAFWTLALLVLGHIAMTIRHNLKGVDVAGSMLPGRVPPLVFFPGLALASAAVVYAAMPDSGAQGTGALSLQGESTALVGKGQTGEPGQQIAQVNKQAAWQLQPQSSRLAFIGSYLGADFKGAFSRFEVSMDFDPESLAGAKIEVSIDVRSATTGSSDMDAMLPDPAWFHFGQHPGARYSSDSVKRSGDGFIADGVLTLKGRSHPVAISFGWEAIQAGLARMTVDAVVNRREFLVGSGEFLNDDSIGFEVKVRADLMLQRQSGQ